MPRPPLRVGLLADSLVQPQWVRRVVEDLQSSAAAEIVLVITNARHVGQAHPRPTLAARLLARRKSLLYLVYRKLDEIVFRTNPDAFGPASIAPLVEHCDRLVISPVATAHSDSFADDDIERIRRYDLDVLLRLGFRILRGTILQVPRYGVWSYHHGDNLVNRGGPAGFWEVMEGQPVTGSVLQVLSDRLDDGKVIYRSYAGSHRYSVARNRNSYYWKSAAFVGRKLADVHERGSAALDEEPAPHAPRIYSDRLYREPGNGEMCRLATKLAARYAAIKARNLTHFQQWFVAWSFGPDAAADSRLYRFRQLEPPPDRYWADPFPVMHRDQYFVFVEEWLRSTRRGHIAVMEIAKDGSAGAPVPVLARDHHLSYPCVFQWRDTFYMVPETAERRRVELYRCVSFPGEWTLDSVLVDDVRAVDATVQEIDGRWWMFVNIGEDGASTYDELHLYYADTPLGPWKPHRRNPVKSDVRSARPAGKLLRSNGDLYRPAQDCAGGYGSGIWLNKVLRLTPDEFREEPSTKVLPRWARDLVATHTLNTTGGLTVVDAARWRPRGMRMH
jgi:hypothetical protein